MCFVRAREFTYPGRRRRHAAVLQERLEVLKGYMAVGYLLFLQEQIKDIIITIHTQTHHHHHHTHPNTSSLETPNTSSLETHTARGSHALHPVHACTTPCPCLQLHRRAQHGGQELEPQPGLGRAKRCPPWPYINYIHTYACTQTAY